MYYLLLEFPVYKVYGRIEVYVRVPLAGAVFSAHVPYVTNAHKSRGVCLYGCPVVGIVRQSVFDGYPFRCSCGEISVQCLADGFDT